MHLRSSPEFSFLLMSQDRSAWPRCLFRHGWLPGLSPAVWHPRWLLATWPSIFWSPLLEHTHCIHDVLDMMEDVSDHPNLRSEGSMEPILHLNKEVAGAGFFKPLPLLASLMTHGGATRRILVDDLKAAHLFFLHLWTPANSPNGGR